MSCSFLPLSRLLAPALAAALTACSPSERKATGDGRPFIVATTTMVHDLARTLGGEDFRIEALMGPGVDPHLFKPSVKDTDRLQQAGVVLYSGLHLEGPLAEILERLQGQGRKVYAVSDALSGDEILRSGETPDPHFWGDASLWAKGVAHCAQKLSAAFPDKAAAISARAEAAVLALTETHARLKAMAAKVPAAQRVMVTSHDAFRYFGRAYDLEVMGVQGISTATEASQSDIVRLADTIRARGIRAVFVETSVSTVTIDRLVRDTGIKRGGELFSDALGQPGDAMVIDGRTIDKGTVCGMLEYNMHTVVEALK